jgi:hypothetical protein
MWSGDLRETMQFGGRDRNALAPLSQLNRMPSIGRVKLLLTLLSTSKEYGILIVEVGINGVTPDRVWLSGNARALCRGASNGINVYGAKIVDELETSCEDVCLPLVFMRC